MRKLKLASFALLGLLLLTNCTKKQDLNITMNTVEDGDLRIRIVDDAGTGIADILVNLNSTYSATPLEKATTDQDGWASFKDILSGTYEIEAKDIVIGTNNYSINQYVQVLAGIEKEYTLNVTDYSGSAIVYIIDYDTSDPIEGLTVGIFKYDDFNYSMEYEDILNIVIADDVTDTDGKVTFDALPLNTYGILVYDESGYAYNESCLYLTEAGVEEEYYFYISYY